MAIAVAVGVTALLLLGFLPVAAQAGTYSSDELAVVQLINVYRADNGLQPLLLSDLLSDSAQKHNSDMAGYGFFSHTTVASSFFPAGSSPGNRMTLCGYPTQVHWGENIAGGWSTPESVFTAWRNSESHRLNILGADWRVIGISGVYDSRSDLGWYWTTDFGSYADATAHAVENPSPADTTSTTATTSTTTTSTLPVTTITTAPPSTTITTVSSPVARFADVPPSSPYYASVYDLATDGVVSGCADGLYHPERGVTRAQMAKMLVLGIGVHTQTVEAVSRPSFEDVVYSGGDYPFDYVEEAAALGIVQGFADGTFRPNVPLTRIQAALILVRAGGGDLSVPSVGEPFAFIDVPKYAHDAVGVALFNHLISGKTSVVFDPYGQASRGQVAKMVYQLRQALGF